MSEELEQAYSVIESCSGFTEDDTPAGEAWLLVRSEIDRLRASLAAAERETKAWREEADRVAAVARRIGEEKVATIKHNGALCRERDTALDRVRDLEAQVAELKGASDD